jgi:hypothetical protein
MTEIKGYFLMREGEERHRTLRGGGTYMRGKSGIERRERGIEMRSREKRIDAL